MILTCPVWTIVREDRLPLGLPDAAFILVDAIRGKIVTVFTLAALAEAFAASLPSSRPLATAMANLEEVEKSMPYGVGGISNKNPILCPVSQETAFSR